MKKLYVIAGGIVAVVALVAYLYFSFFVNANSANRLERQAFISHGHNNFEITILNGNGPTKVYQAVTKPTPDEQQKYYFFWAMINGKRLYVQVPMEVAVIEEK